MTDIIQASDFAQARDQNALLKSLATAYVIEFADQGAGIPEDVRSAVFQPFIRGDAARTGSEGTGLGLSITRKIIDLHQGKLELDHTPEEITIFRIRLPLRE